MESLCPKSYEMTRDGTACCKKQKPGEATDGEVQCVPVMHFPRSEQRFMPHPPRINFEAPISYVAVRHRQYYV